MTHPTDGPYCRVCQLHRSMTAGGLCPLCADDQKREKESR